MQLVPFLVLDEESTFLLCDESSSRSTSPSGKTSIPHELQVPAGEESDDNVPAVSVDEMHEPSSSDSTSDSPELPTPIDGESQAPVGDEDCSLDLEEVDLVEDTSDRSLRSLYDSPEEGVVTDALGGLSRQTQAGRVPPRRVSKTLKDAVKPVNKAVKGTEKVVNKAVKQTQKTVKTTAKSTEKVMKKTTTEIVNLPHEATTHWFHLTALLFILAILPVVLSTPNFLPKQSSVNLGLKHNRGFLYGTHTILEVFVNTAIISTCHFAIDKATIPIGARVLANVIGLSVGKIALMMIAEAWWTPHLGKVFPVPFSFIVTTVAAIPFVLGTLRLLTPMQSDPDQRLKVRKKFHFLFGTIAAYIFSLLVACVWGIVFRQLEFHPIWQSVWVFALFLFELLCKIFLTTNLTTRLNGRKWIQLTLVVDLIFVSVQTAMIPFFATYYSVGLSIFGCIVTISFRAYGGVDRFRLFWDLLRKTIRESSSGPFGMIMEVAGIGVNIFTENTRHIHRRSLSFRLGGNGRPTGSRNDWDEEKSLSLRLSGNGRRANSRNDWDEESGVGRGDRSIERAETSETASLGDYESSDSSATGDSNGWPFRNREELSTAPDAFSRAGRRPASLTVSDRRALFANSKSLPADGDEMISQLIQTDGRQRHCYHIVDAVSSALINIEVRLAGLITLAAIRAYAVREHLNESFQLDDRQFTLSVVYNLIFIVANILVILGVGVYIQRGLKLGGLTLNRVISHVFRDSFWFMFFWLCLQQQLTIAIYFNHYGADFSMQFEWLSCRESMLYPRCTPPP